jgi:hypothetical protein
MHRSARPLYVTIDACSLLQIEGFNDTSNGRLQTLPRALSVFVFKLCNMIVGSLKSLAQSLIIILRNRMFLQRLG